MAGELPSHQSGDDCMDNDLLDFSPALLRLQEKPPNPLGQKVIWVLLALLGALLVWAMVGQLDIVAVAEGKLVPHSYVQIVQPSESGIVKEILVKEGDTVLAGQVLMRMDTLATEADSRSLEAEFQRKSLLLRRINAELSGNVFTTLPDDPPELASEVDAQYRANRVSLEAALAEESSRLVKAKYELQVAEQTQEKLTEVLPHFRKQERAYADLAREKIAADLVAGEKRMERIEKEQELLTQSHLIGSAKASIKQSEKRLAQIESDYFRQLHVERNEFQGQLERLTEEVTKQRHRSELMELKAPQDSIVKELTTHTAGTVVQPGMVLLTLVPKDDILRAEIWVSNEDIGFIRNGLPVKLKFAAFPFQKYGMLEGTVEHVSADAADEDAKKAGSSSPDPSGNSQSLGYRALVKLNELVLENDGRRYPLSPGMVTHAEIHLGERTVMEYLLSPVRKAWHEAGRER